MYISRQSRKEENDSDSDAFMGESEHHNYRSMFKASVQVLMMSSDSSLPVVCCSRPAQNFKDLVESTDEERMLKE